MKKKTDELHRQVQRAQIKFKMAGGDEKAKVNENSVKDTIYNQIFTETSSSLWSTIETFTHICDIL